MKQLHHWILVLLCGTFTSLCAESVNDQIEAIMKAPPQKKVALMNKLKVQLAAMNEEERSKAISALQKEMGNTQTSPSAGMHNAPALTRPMPQNTLIQRQSGTIAAPRQPSRQ